VWAIHAKVLIFYLLFILAIALFTRTPAVGQADDKEEELARGRKLFNQCKACHTLEPNGPSDAGPHLYGVVGRKSATVENYTYSDAMKAANLTWTPENLDAFLKSPADLVPGTDMAYPGMKDPAGRKALIEFLKTKGPSTESKP
jgi:cytochrome c